MQRVLLVWVSLISLHREENAKCQAYGFSRPKSVVATALPLRKLYANLSPRSKVLYEHFSIFEDSRRNRLSLGISGLSDSNDFVKCRKPLLSLRSAVPTKRRHAKEAKSLLELKERCPLHQEPFQLIG